MRHLFLSHFFPIEPHGQKEVEEQARTIFGCCTRLDNLGTGTFSYDPYHEGAHLTAACTSIRTLTVHGNPEMDPTPLHDLEVSPALSLERVVLINVTPSFDLVENLLRIETIREVEWRWHRPGWNERLDFKSKEERTESMGEPFPDMPSLWAVICVVFSMRYEHVPGTLYTQSLTGQSLPRCTPPPDVRLGLTRRDAERTRKILETYPSPWAKDMLDRVSMEVVQDPTEGKWYEWKTRCGFEWMWGLYDEWRAGIE